MRQPEVESRLATGRGTELARRAAAEGVLVVEVPWRAGIDLSAVWRLRRFLRAFQPDVVHAHDSHALTVAWAATRAARVRAIQLVATRRVDFHVRRMSVWRAADHIIAISNAVKTVLAADGFAGREISVVPSGIDPDEVRRSASTSLNIRSRLGLPDGTPLAVNVAALVDHKDQRTLVRAAGHARALRPDLHWAVAGDGELRGSLEAEVARLDLRDRVHLLGYVGEADALIREGNVFVMSSKEEGLGSVILNALALEKPVVATAGGGIPEILPPEALVPVGNPEALARKVVEAIAHPSPVPLPPQFTVSAMARGVLAVYRSLV